MVGSVLAAAHVPGVQPVPGERSVDPPAACAGPQEPRGKPQSAASGHATLPQRQLDRERRARCPRRRSVDQRAERPLPRRLRCPRAAGRSGHAAAVRGRHRPTRARRLAAATRGRDHDRGDVLAVPADRTRAFTLGELRRVGPRDEERRRVVQPTPADDRTGERPLAGVPPECLDPVTARVGAATLKGRGAHRLLDLDERDIAEFRDDGHAGTLTSAADRNDAASSRRPEPSERGAAEGEGGASHRPAGGRRARPVLPRSSSISCWRPSSTCGWTTSPRATPSRRGSTSRRSWPTTTCASRSWPASASSVRTTRPLSGSATTKAASSASSRSPAPLRAGASRHQPWGRAPPGRSHGSAPPEPRSRSGGPSRISITSWPGRPHGVLVEVFSPRPDAVPAELAGFFDLVPRSGPCP